MKWLVLIVLALGLAGTSAAATEVTPRERALARQVAVLKGQVRKLKTTNTRLKTQRDASVAEAKRLRGLIVHEVHALANSWRNDGDEKTGVSFYESENYWSYSFTYCGFC